jgi:hypothetical protein
MLHIHKFINKAALSLLKKNHGRILVLCQLLEHKTKRGTLNNWLYTHKALEPHHMAAQY